MTKKPDDNKFNETVKNLLKTPPKPHGEALAEPDMFIVLDGVFRIVRRPIENEDGSMTGELYRNLADYKRDQPMDRAFSFWL